MAKKSSQPQQTQVDQVEEAEASSEVEQNEVAQPEAVAEVQVQEAQPQAQADLVIRTSYMEQGDIGITLSEALQSAIGKMVSTYGDVPKIPMLEIAEFCKAMMPPKQVDPTEGARAQQRLWQTVQNVLNTEGAQYALQLSCFLGIIHEYSNTVFADQYVFRFQDHVQLNVTQRRGMRLVLTMLKEVADPSTRLTNAKTVRPTVAMAGIFNEHAISQMLKYLQVEK